MPSSPNKRKGISLYLYAVGRRGCRPSLKAIPTFPEAIPTILKAIVMELEAIPTNPEAIVMYGEMWGVELNGVAW